jgi:integrator complex subunit 11
MSQIKVIPLGAGQDVGRSCIVVSICGRNIMFDCGMHMGYNDDRRFPDFSLISKTKNFDQIIDCVIISHFHLDHCGALPYFTEMCGYTGPIFMTYPTKAICPILLEDFRKITVERKGDTNFFTSQMIKDCMKKVTAVNVNETIKIDDEFELKAYYAGHVLGAAMFYVRVGTQSVVYTGDYNMTPDRHLGAASIERVRPNLLITETTYATTIRDSKRCRERDFLKIVHETIDKGGKVLIPVFALGRAQELCILVETYWERMNLSVPVYFSAGLTEKANLYYKLFINWTNQKIKNTFVRRNMFDFKHIRPFERNLVDKPGPMVLFATPGMLHAGTSLDVFKKWCGNELNLCIFPGYCVVGTVGNKILTSPGPIVEIDKKTKLEVKCQVKSLSFSAHADAKGIMQLIQQCQPDNVMLVHGEKQKMEFLQQRIVREFGIPCYAPANGEILTISPSTSVNKFSNAIPIDISRHLLNKQYYNKLFVVQHQQYPKDKISDQTEFDDSFFDLNEETEHNKAVTSSLENLSTLSLPILEKTPVSGVLVMTNNSDKVSVKLLDVSEAAEEIGVAPHKLKISQILTLKPGVLYPQITEPLLNLLQNEFSNEGNALRFNDIILIKSVTISQQQEDPAKVVISWDYEDNNLGGKLVRVIQNIIEITEPRKTTLRLKM